MKHNKIKNFPVGLVCAASFLAFTFCVFGPLQMYITNADEFFFSIGDIWWICAIAFLTLTALTTAAGLLLKGGLRETYGCLLWGIALGLYIQGNFIITDYGAMDGRTDWSAYEGVSLWNTALWLLCIITPIVLYKILPKVWKSICNYLSFGILAVQVITLCTLLVTADTKPSTEVILTNEGKFRLSKDENILVFVLDAYDAQYFTDFIETYPEYKETILSNFTYYADTVGGGFPTALGMPYILTSTVNMKELPYSEYIREGYRSTRLYHTLQEAGYDIGIYTETKFVSPEMKGAVINLTGGKKEVSSYQTLAYYLYRFTACRYLPHILKESVWMYSGDFDQAADNSGDVESPYVIDDALFYENLKNEIELQEENNAFRLYHLTGCHTPYTLDAQSRRSSMNTSLEEQQIGVWNILRNYFEQMKQLDIYDRANIIILADHGQENMGQNPLLLIKKGTTARTFTVSDLPVSYSKLHPTILSLIQVNDTGDKSIFELTKEDNLEGGQDYAADRLFYRLEGGQDYAKEYLIRGNAAEPANVHETGKKFRMTSTKNSTSNKYILGTLLYFDLRSTGNVYVTEGFSHVESAYTWTSGKEAMLEIPLKKVPTEDLFASISIVQKITGRQRVGVSINGDMLNYYNVTDETLNFRIPADMLSSENLEIRFDLPDAVSPRELGQGSDDRTLSLAFFSMNIRNMQEDDQETEKIVFDFSKKIDFTTGGDSASCCKKGFSGQESGGTWISRTDAVQSFLFPDKPAGNLKVDIDLSAIFGGSQDVTIYFNDVCVYDCVQTEMGISFIVPQEAIKVGTQEVLYHVSTGSPAELYGSSDTRNLSIMVKSMTISETDLDFEEVIPAN